MVNKIYLLVTLAFFQCVRPSHLPMLPESMFGAPPVDVPDAERTGYPAKLIDGVSRPLRLKASFGALPEGLICGLSFLSVGVAFVRQNIFLKHRVLNSGSITCQGCHWDLG